MRAKLDEKNEAIKLRRQGHSYSEILEKIHVAKSSLSLWLGNLKISKKANNSLKSKLESAQMLGAAARHNQRIIKVAKIEKEAISEIPKIRNRDLFLIGLMLYWGEGAKISETNISQRVDFSNSDPIMCRIFLKWLRICINISDDNIVPCIYIHESKKGSIENALQYWSKQISFPVEKFGNTCLTKTVYPREKPRKTVESYFGQLRIRVRKSTDLNRKIAGWTKGVCIQSGVVVQNFV